MNVLKEATMPDSFEPLKAEDKEDCDKALSSLSNGIKNLQCNGYILNILRLHCLWLVKNIIYF